MKDKKEAEIFQKKEDLKKTKTSSADFLLSSIENSSQKRNDEEKKNPEKILAISREILNLQKQNLELSLEIKKLSSYVQRYVKMRRIFAAIKWTFFILIVILGFLSFNFVFDYLQDTISVYQDQVNQIVEQRNNFR